MKEGPQSLVDMGWWWYCTRRDGLPLTWYQYLGYMIISVPINLIFSVVMFALAILYVFVWPVEKFRESYARYRKQHERQKARVWKALKDE